MESSSNVHNFYTADVKIFNEGPDDGPFIVPVEKAMVLKTKPKEAVECPFAARAFWKTDFEAPEEPIFFQMGHHYIVSLPAADLLKEQAKAAGAFLWIPGMGPDAIVKDATGAIRGTKEMLRVV